MQIAPAATARVHHGHQLLVQAACRGIPIYGYNRGPGDQQGATTFGGDPASPDNRERLTAHNLKLFCRGAASGAGPEVAREDIVRATMLARLNTMLTGHSGVSPKPVQMLAAMLNRRLAPVLRTHGSVGQSDFPVMANVAAAMVGAGLAHLAGSRMTASQALQRAGIAPLAPVDRDYGSVIASNAYAAGQAALLVADTARLLDWADVIYALSLQAQNGNVSPLLEPVQRTRPYPHQQASARRILELLAGSHLLYTSPHRRLQDPLSFRDVSQLHGAARRAAELLHADILLQLNSSDDNPTIATDAPHHPLESAPQAATYRLTTPDAHGIVMPNANYDPTIWVQSVELQAIALARVAAGSVQRAIHLRDTVQRQAPNHEDEVQGDTYAMLSLLAEIESLAAPHIGSRSTLASGIEDLVTFAAHAISRCSEIVEQARRLLAHELLCAALCIDRRRDTKHDLPLGNIGEATLAWVRQSVPRRHPQRPERPPAETLYELLGATSPERALT